MRMEGKGMGQKMDAFMQFASCIHHGKLARALRQKSNPSFTTTLWHFVSQDLLGLFLLLSSMLPVRDQRPRAISLNHTTLPTQHRHHARAENDRTYMQRIPRYTGLVASKSESTVSRKREARRRDNPNTHSIWSQPVIHEHQHETEAKTQHSKHDAVTRKIREMFSDVLKDNLDSWEDMLFHLRTVIDHQALRIKSLEDMVVHGIYTHVMPHYIILLHRSEPS